MPLLRDSPDDFAALVGRAALESGLDPAFVEKDYWVTELLRSLTNPISAPGERPPAPVVVFKGGTSLSKAYGLIERFSEDIDILMVPPAEFGVGAIDRVLKSLVERVSGDLGLQNRLVTSTRGVKRNVSYDYPALHSASVLRSDLLLEMGIRGGAMPSNDVAITSYVSRLAAKIDLDLAADDLESVAVQVLAPERTLVEKLQLVHTASSRIDQNPDALGRAGRHFYDIHQLVVSSGVMTALDNLPGGISELAEDIHQRSEEAGFDSVRRPSGGYGESPAFADGDLLPLIRSAYDQIEPLVWGRLPAVEEVMTVVEESVARL